MERIIPALFIICFFLKFLFLFPIPEANALTASRGMIESMKAGSLGSGAGGVPPGPFGDHWVHIQNNANIDSYDSRIGPYDETRGAEVNVFCNVNPDDSEAGVSMNNNGTVSGDISVTTSEEDGDVRLENNSNFSGQTHYDCPEWQLLPINMPGWYTEAGGGPNGQIEGSYGSKPGRYEITNNNFRAYNNASVIFHAGEYHYDNFELSNNVDFQVDPDIGEDETIDIYVSNSIIFENNSELLPAIEFSGDTTKLRFYFEGTNTVDLSNNVEFYGFIYAPNAQIEIRNNDEIYGNMVGKEIWLWNNAGIHFDKALMGEEFGHIIIGGTPTTPHERIEWQEIIISD